MNDFNVEDVVLVYKDTPTFKDGTIAQVIDRDPHDNSYAVADLRDVGRADRDISIILERYVKWVDPKNMKLLTFDRPKQSNFKKNLLLGGLMVGSLVGFLVYMSILNV